MSDRLALDTNAVVDLIRPNRPNPPLLPVAQNNVLPLPVAGELYAGAFTSERRDENIATVERLLRDWTIITASLQTARIYGRLRGDIRFPTSPSRLNDLWIAAVCLEHGLPLLTNDRGLDLIPGLVTIHW